MFGALLVKKEWFFKACTVSLMMLAALRVQCFLRDSASCLVTENICNGFLWYLNRFCFSRKSQFCANLVNPNSQQILETVIDRKSCQKVICMSGILPQPLNPFEHQENQTTYSQSSDHTLYFYVFSIWLEGWFFLIKLGGLFPRGQVSTL